MPVAQRPSRAPGQPLGSSSVSPQPRGRRLPVEPAGLPGADSAWWSGGSGPSAAR